MPEETCQVQFLRNGPLFTTKITSPLGTVISIDTAVRPDAALEDGLSLTYQVLKVCTGKEGADSAMTQLGDAIEQRHEVKG